MLLRYSIFLSARMDKLSIHYTLYILHITPVLVAKFRISNKTASKRNSIHPSTRIIALLASLDANTPQTAITTVEKWGYGR